MNECIPEKFIRDYVDTLIATARRLGPGPTEGDAVLLRADHVMDLVKVWRDRHQPPQEKSRT